MPQIFLYCNLQEKSFTSSIPVTQWSASWTMHIKNVLSIGKYSFIPQLWLRLKIKCLLKCCPTERDEGNKMIKVILLNASTEKLFQFPAFSKLSSSYLSLRDLLCYLERRTGQSNLRRYGGMRKIQICWTFLLRILLVIT